MWESWIWNLQIILKKIWEYARTKFQKRGCRVAAERMPENVTYKEFKVALRIEDPC